MLISQVDKFKQTGSIYISLSGIYKFALKVGPLDSKYPVHVIKFYPNWVEFIADDLMQQEATSHQLTLLYQNVGCMSKSDPKKRPMLSL
jgi:hypothetical protein